MENSTFYQQRINKAVAHINQHLKEDIRIAQLADIAHFSAFHFQRLYKALQGESPYETLLRLRLEKAIFLLKNYAQLKVLDIAFECGFASVENFSRQFKARFQCTPSAYKKSPSLQNSRIYHENVANDFYHRIEESRAIPPKSFAVTIEKLAAIPIAFIRAIFGHDGSLLVQRYQKLMSWALNQQIPYQGLLTRFGMSIDNPEVTPANKYRYDFAIKVAQPFVPEGLIEYGEIPQNLFATVHCIGKLNDVAQAWDYLYKHWLPSSGYIPVHYPAIEEFVQGPEEIGWEDFNVKCRIPVLPKNAVPEII